MTATPIPRTLLLTSYGDMDVSRLDEKPPGRKPIATRIVPLERLDEVVVRHRARRFAGGAQVYWVCPLVAESEVLDLAAAEERYAELRNAIRRSRRTGPWPAGRQGQGSRHGGVRLGRAVDPGVHHRDRGRRRRAERLDHDHRACRAVRPGSTASIARPGRTGRRGVLLHPALPSSHCRRRRASG